MLFFSFVCCFSRILYFLSVPGKQEQAELHAVLRTEIMREGTCLDCLQCIPSVTLLKCNLFSYAPLTQAIECFLALWRLLFAWLCLYCLKLPLDCKEIQPVHPEGDKSWVFIGRTDAEAETSILWPPHVKSWLIGKDPDAGRDWGQEEKGMTEDEMAGWHRQLNEHDFK